MQRFIAQIGSKFGETAIYWRDGVQVCWRDQNESRVQAVAEVTCHHEVKHATSGEVLIRIWGDSSRQFLDELRKIFDQRRDSRREIEESISVDGQHWESAKTATPVDVTTESLTARDALKTPAQLAVRSEPLNPAIYISYAWGDAFETTPGFQVEIVDRLFESLKAEGFDVRRDVQDVGYRGDLNAFMREMGQASCIVAVVSHTSLQSPFCMHELCEVHRNLGFTERLFPIVLEDARIKTPEGIQGYVKYWNDRWETLDSSAGPTISKSMSVPGFQEFVKLREIARRADEVITALAMMQTSSPRELEAKDFELLKQSISQWFEKLGGKAIPSPQIRSWPSPFSSP